MKKFLCAFMLLIVTLCGQLLVACSSNNNSSQTNQEKEHTNNDNDNNTINNNLEFLFFSIDWDNPVYKNSISLYNNKLSFPMSLHDFDELNAPYTYYYYESLSSHTNTINSLSELAQCTQFIQPGSDLELFTSDTKLNNINYIYVHNLSEQPMTIAECYNNNWLSLQADTTYNHLEELLDLPSEKCTITNPESPNLINLIIQKFGTPTNVYFLNADANEKLILNSGGITYELVYELNDYTIIICVQEVIVSNDFHSLELIGFYYFPYEEPYENHKLECNYNNILKYPLTNQ